MARDGLLIKCTEVVKRAIVPPGKTLLAEHGFSLLTTVSVEYERYTVIMDAGVSSIPIIQNAESLGIDFASLEGILISHGHIDHFGGLSELRKNTPEQTVLRAHPAAFRERRINIAPMDIITDLSVLKETAIKEAGIHLDINLDPPTLADGTILCLGEVERTTDFEKGFPQAEVKVDDQWIPDDFPDDQGMTIRLKSGGLVVIGGCSHARIINIINYAQSVTGTDQVESVLGGKKAVIESGNEPSQAHVKVDTRGQARGTPPFRLLENNHLHPPMNNKSYVSSFSTINPDF